MNTYSLLPGAVVLSITRESVDKETIVGRVLHGLLEQSDSDVARNDLTILDHSRDYEEEQKRWSATVTFEKIKIIIFQASKDLAGLNQLVRNV